MLVRKWLDVSMASTQSSSANLLQKVSGSRVDFSFRDVFGSVTHVKCWHGSAGGFIEAS